MTKLSFPSRMTQLSTNLAVEDALLQRHRKSEAVGVARQFPGIPTRRVKSETQAMHKMVVFKDTC